MKPPWSRRGPALKCPECGQSGGFVVAAQVFDAHLGGGRPTLHQRAFDLVCRSCGAAIELSPSGLHPIRRPRPKAADPPALPPDDPPDTDLALPRSEQRRRARLEARRREMRDEA